jgi:2-aminoadipate transaminase
VQDGVRAALLAGSLAPGLRLPAEREMAVALGVNRSTVTRAYQELVAEGLVESHGSRGTVVVPRDDAAPGPPSWMLTLPALAESGVGPDPTLLRDLTASVSRRGVISFAAGAPGLDLMPVEEVRAGLDDGLRRWGTSALTYGPVEGFPPLREALRARFAGLLAPGDDVLVVTGATQGLALAARTLVEAGDEVVVETPTYIGTLQTFALAGARLIGVPVDRDGLRVDLLEAILARRRVRLVIVQPTYHNPTGAVLAPRRRERLLYLARRHGVPILEDDAYHGLGFQDESDLPGPLKAEDRHGSVVYLGTFSKTVLPAIRIAWMVAPEPVLARLTLAKQYLDLNTNLIGQVALASFLDSGGQERHVRAVRSVYRQRRDALLAELARQAPRLEVPDVPPGGFYLWCRLTAGPHARLLAALAAREGLALVAGEAFTLGGGRGGGGTDRVRLCYSGCTPDVAVEGVRRLAVALEELPGLAAAGEPAAGTRAPVVV